jgi:hypothetical protein
MYVARFCSLCFICFSNVCCKCVYGCCIPFTHILQVFYLDAAYILQCFSSIFQVLFASVSEAHFKCFIYLQTYVANVSFWYFKSRSGVTYGDVCGKREGARAVAARSLAGRGDVQVARETSGDTLVESAGASECGARETECSLGVRMQGSVRTSGH